MMMDHIVQDIIEEQSTRSDFERGFGRVIPIRKEYLALSFGKNMIQFDFTTLIPTTVPTISYSFI
jgi:hypothetical protein